MSKLNPNRRINSKKGQALIEFCLVFIILLLMTLGAVDFARGFSTYQRMAALGREGGRLYVKNTFNTNLSTTDLKPLVKTKVYDVLSTAMKPDNLATQGGVIITVLRRSDGVVPTAIAADGTASGDDDDQLQIVHQLVYGNPSNGFTTSKINQISTGGPYPIASLKDDGLPATPNVADPVIPYDTVRVGEELVVVEIFYKWQMLTGIDGLFPSFNINTLYDRTVF